MALARQCLRMPMPINKDDKTAQHGLCCSSRFFQCRVASARGGLARAGRLTKGWLRRRWPK